MTTPTPVPLPGLPVCDFWTDAQWETLHALLDAVFAPVVPESAMSDKRAQVRLADDDFAAAYNGLQRLVANPPSKEDFAAYLAWDPVKDTVYRDNCKRTFAHIPAEAQRRLGAILSLLATQAGSLILTGYCVPVHQQPMHVRQAILRSWQTARWTVLRMIAKSMIGVATKSFTQTNTLFKRIGGYPDVPDDYQHAPATDFRFLQFDPSDGPATVETDVVVVGSGCGGAVVAKTLAEAGHRVLVVDKGYYFPPSQLPMTQAAAVNYMFENSGFLTTDDSSMTLVAGASWGGGGTVNWSVSFQTQGHVRQEWAEKHGLPLFTSEQFQDSLDRVCDVMGVDVEHVQHNHRNRMLLDGARRLGWQAGVAPQNSGRKEHYCGRCHLGCHTNGKRGPTVAWLPAAVEAGAQCIEGFTVDKVIIDEADGVKRATGVVGMWVSRDEKGGVDGPQSERTTRQVIVKAKKVVLACGTMWSPLVLLKSGLTNRHIGQHLHAHPATFVMAFYKEDTAPVEGGHITSYVSEFDNQDGHGYGVKLESTCMDPYAIYSYWPWQGSMDFKIATLRYKHAATFISMNRDRSEGHVYADPVSGRPRIAYTMSSSDADFNLEGIIALAKICYVTGATEIQPLIPGLEPFVRQDEPDVGENELKSTSSGINDPAFAAWLGRLRAVGNRPPVTPCASAHQMGTCRMSRIESEGVVDPRGQVWGVEDLLVADASVFPSASGVNPMVTNMAIADWIARGLDREMRSG